ncbi:hypothetical protein H9P43_006054 [Blastocladiella emersonii ATCC 22665]|nr:hypothetical protein H9P43_006054 [Blastocladiella emersonii ATCC 22665]
MKQKKGKSTKAHRKAAGGLLAAASHDEGLTSGPSDAPSVPLAPPTQTSATLALDEETDPYLPYGRSFPRDLLMYHNPRESKHLGALVFQCGDLRDVAHTVGEAKRKYGTANLDFVLSDTHFEVLARNLLVLRAVSLVKITDRITVTTLARHVGQLTYSLYLDPATRAFWAEQMRACLATDWTALDAQVRVLDDATRRGVRACWESWLAVGWSPAKFDQARTAFYDAARARKGPRVKSHADLAAATVMHRLRKEVMTGSYGEDEPWNLERDIGKLAAEGTSFLDFGGVARPKALSVNPTMLVAAYPVCDPGVVRFSAPYGVTPLDVFHIDPYAGPRISMARDLELWVNALVDVFGSGSSSAPLTGTYPPFRCRLAVIGGHPTSVMESLVAMQLAGQTSYTAIETDRVLPLWFNAVHTGATIETCGLLSVLVHASPLLANNWEHDRSLIFTATDHVGAIAKTRREFLRRTMGLSHEAFPTLLGLTQVDRPVQDHWQTHTTPFTWNTEQAAIASKAGVDGRQEFTFAKLPTPTVPISLRESPFIINAFVRCAELLLGPDSVAMAGRRAGPHATAALLIKLLGFALASSRLTWTGGDILPFAPWPAMPELWDALGDSGVLTASLAELQAQAILYGFPVDLGGRKKKGFETDVYRVEGIIDATALNAVRAAAPLSHMVLEISMGGIMHQFRSLATKSVDEGQKLRVATYVPRYVAKGAGGDEDLEVRARFVHGLHQSLSEDAKSVPLTGTTTDSVPADSRAGVYSGIIYYPNVTRFDPINARGPSVLSRVLELTVVHVAELPSEIHLVLAVPRAYLGSGSIKCCDFETRQKAVGAIMVKYGDHTRMQAMQLGCGPAMLTAIKALSVHPHDRVLLVLDRYIAPTSPVFGLTPLVVNLPDYSDVYTPSNLYQTWPQHTASDVMMRAVSVENSELVAKLVARSPHGTHMALMHATHIITIYGTMFQEFWAGARIIELVAAETGKVAAVFLLHRIAVVPPPDAARGYKPVLDCSYIKHPDYDGRRADPATAQLKPQIARKCTLRPAKGDSIVYTFRIPDPYMVTIFENLHVADRAAPSKEVHNDFGFDPAFFAKLKPRLTRTSLIQLYPTQDREQSLNPSHDVSEAKMAAAAAAYAAAQGGGTPVHRHAAPAPAPARHRASSSRIEEID